MGHLQATEMASMGIDINMALDWHLQSNHYPPLPVSLVPVCRQAIEAAQEGLWDDTVPLPDGVTYGDETSAPVWAVVEEYHLDAWVE